MSAVEIDAEARAELTAAGRRVLAIALLQDAIAACRRSSECDDREARQRARQAARVLEAP